MKTLTLSLLLLSSSAFGIDCPAGQPCIIILPNGAIVGITNLAVTNQYQLKLSLNSIPNLPIRDTRPLIGAASDFEVRFINLSPPQSTTIEVSYTVTTDEGVEAATSAAKSFLPWAGVPIVASTFKEPGGRFAGGTLLGQVSAYAYFPVQYLIFSDKIKVINVRNVVRTESLFEFANQYETRSVPSAGRSK